MSTPFLTVDGEMDLCGEKACYNWAVILNCLMPSSLPHYFVTCTSQFLRGVPHSFLKAGSHLDVV